MKLILILACCTFSLDASAEPLGRLFHTPEQRALLDNARKTMPMNASGEEQVNSAPDFMLKGIVTRSDGQRSVWLNGRVEHGVGRASDRVPVQLPGGEIKLKVGQSIDPASGRVTENYRRPPPEPIIPKPVSTVKEPSKAPATKPHDEDSDVDKSVP